jgi:predicted O-methyltransferase YrrM
MMSVESSMGSMGVTQPTAVAPSSSFKDTSSSGEALDAHLDNTDSFTPSEDDTHTQQRHSANSLLLQRDPRNGAFTFQVHAEYDLLLYVQKDLDRHHQKLSRRSSTSITADGTTGELEPARIILKSIDNYCLSKQWMYHIGYEKAVVVRNFLQRSLHDFIARHSDELYHGKRMRFVAVDLGTYCGYSALVMCHAIQSLLIELQATGDSRANHVEFEVITTEVSSKLMNVAQSIFRLGKVDKFVSPILIKDGDLLSDVLKKHFNDTVKIDFLLLDHSKTLYLTDLIDLEKHRFLGIGSYVSADNVVFNRLDSYRDHMATLAREGVVQTKLEEMNLEYSNNLKDGIGELLLYDL